MNAACNKKTITAKRLAAGKKESLIEQNFHKLQLLSQCQNMSHSQSLPSLQSTSATKSPSALPKVGILGGGQLGRMLLQAAANYVVETFVLENDDNAPAAHLCHH